MSPLLNFIIGELQTGAWITTENGRSPCMWWPLRRGETENSREPLTQSVFEYLQDSGILRKVERDYWRTKSNFDRWSISGE